MINEKLTNKQINNISTYINNLNKAKNKIISLEKEINSSWKADEVRYINNALDKVTLEITKVTKMMDSLKIDISKALSSIKGEEASKNMSN